VAGDQPKIDGAIIDKELKKWLEAILQKGASIWFIADCCHSGTLARGDDVARGFDPRDLLSPEQRRKLGDVGSRSRGAAGKAVALDPPAATKGNGSFVGLYASQPYEETFEATFGG